MITAEETEAMMERLFQSRPREFFQKADSTRAGIGCLMHILAKAEEPVSAGALSAEARVSTARIAVLLKKMEQKGLIVRQSDPEDARKTKISLSAFGRETHEQFRAEMR